jgi:hypothetical protein
MTGSATPSPDVVPAGSPLLRVDRVRKAFGDHVVLDDLSRGVGGHRFHGGFYVFLAGVFLLIKLFVLLGG